MAMERLEYDSYGGPDVVRLRVFTLPPPSADEVVVRVAAASINPMDWKIRNGDMKLITGYKFPRAMGTDFAGVVEAVGADVQRFRPGDEVVGTASMKRSGAFAPRVTTTQKLLAPKPKALSFVESASLPIAGVTAWHVLIKTARLKRGQRLFINGASGAVGQAAISIARGLGAEVVGSVGSQSVGLARDMGISLVLDYTRPIPTSLDNTFDVIFDVSGSLSPQEGERLVKPGGGIIDIVPTKIKFLKSIWSRSRRFLFAEVTAENLQQALDLAAAGKLSIPVVRTISLTEAPAFLASLEQGKRLNGKVVITFT